MQPDGIEQEPDEDAGAGIRAARFAVPRHRLDASHGPRDDWHPKAQEQASAEFLKRRQLLGVARERGEVVSVGGREVVLLGTLDQKPLCGSKPDGGVVW